MAQRFLYNSLLAEYPGVNVYLWGWIIPSKMVNDVIEEGRHNHVIDLLKFPDDNSPRTKKYLVNVLNCVNF